MPRRLYLALPPPQFYAGTHLRTTQQHRRGEGDLKRLRRIWDGGRTSGKRLFFQVRLPPSPLASYLKRLGYKSKQRVWGAKGRGAEATDGGTTEGWAVAGEVSPRGGGKNTRKVGKSGREKEPYHLRLLPLLPPPPVHNSADLDWELMPALQP